MAIMIGWQYKGDLRATLWSHSEAPEELELAKRLVEEDNAELPPEDGQRVVIVTGASEFKMLLSEQQVRALEKLAVKLKHTEPCYAARHEGQPCNTADCRWAGRELLRILKETR